MTLDDALEVALAQNLAMTNLMTRLVLPALAAADTEAFKQRLDEEAERCERILARPPQTKTRKEVILRDASTHELTLLREAFDGIGRG